MASVRRHLGRPALRGDVSYLERELDELAVVAGNAELERMAELFELTTRYEIAFWEMAATGETWPGIAEKSRC